MMRSCVTCVLLILGLYFPQMARAGDLGCSEAYRQCLDEGGEPTSCAAARKECLNSENSPHRDGWGYHHSWGYHSGPTALSPPKAAPSPIPGPPQAAPARALALRPVRAYLRAAEVPPPTVGAYGLVAFRAKPTSSTRARLLMACAAFTASLPRQQDLAGVVPTSEQMVTIWPLDEPDAPQAKNDDCDFLIDHYELYGGVSAIEDADRRGATLNGEGPYLIGWSPSNARGVPDQVVLVVDLSGFESQDSFNSAFLFWQKKIVEDPQLWRSGFMVERIRLALRDFVDRYGNDILSAVKIFGPKD